MLAAPMPLAGSCKKLIGRLDTLTDASFLQSALQNRQGFGCTPSKRRNGT